MDYWVTYCAGQERLGGNRLTLVNRPKRTMWMCDGKLRLQKGRSMAVSEKLFDAYHDEFQKAAEAKLIRIQHSGPTGPDFLFGEQVEEEQVEEEKPLAPPVTVSAPPPPPPPPPAPMPKAKPVVEPPVEAVGTESAKPVDKMTKAELVDYLVEKGFDQDELGSATKKELLEEAKLQAEAE